MKNVSKILNFLFISSMFFTACQKEELLTEQNSINNQTYQLNESLLNGVDVDNGLLSFETKEDYLRVSQLLEDETDKWISDYVSTNELNEEELNDLIYKEKFDPFAVYESFEEYFSYKSLRKDLKEKEDKWLNSAEINSEDLPFYPISERCSNIANEKGEYIISNTIYKVEKDGLVYEIKNNDFEVLDQIRTGQFNINKSSNKNVIVHRAEARANDNLKSTSCYAYIRRTHTVWNGDYKMLKIIDLDWDGWGSAAKAKTKAYKKKKKLFGGYKWVRQWTSMTAQVAITDYDIDCNFEASYNSGIKSRNWAYYVSVHVYESGLGMRTQKNGTFWGRHSTGSVSASYIVYN
jgi:hypothetical protein